MLTVNSPFLPTNSLVPSSGSTTHSRLQPRRVAQGTWPVSSESTGTSAAIRLRPARISFSERRSASVSGEWSSFSFTVKADS